MQLPMPLNLQQEKHTDFSFTGGAGRASNTNGTAEMNKVATAKNDPQSPEQQFPVTRLQDSPSLLDKVEDQEVPLRRSSRKSAEKLRYAFSSSSDGDSEHSDFKRKRRRDRHSNNDTLPSASSLPQTGATIDYKVNDTATMSTMWTTGPEDVQTLHESNTKEQLVLPDSLKGSLKQTSLTSFLTNIERPKCLQASGVEVIELEDSPLKVEAGNSERARKSARKSLVEEESEDIEPSGDESSSSDSAVPTNIGTGRGRGRGRGKGRGGAAGRTGTPRKTDAKRRQTVTEISSSDEGDES